MKFTKENIKKLSYNKDTKLYRKGTHYYIYRNSCSVCGDPYLTDIRQDGKFCDMFCSNKNKNSGIKNNKWKGGVTKKNIPLYDTYAHQISFAEEVRRCHDDENILQVRCAYCSKWYIPKRIDVKHRIESLNGKNNGEYRFYCSNECKKECPIYKKSKFSAEGTNTKQLSREVQPELRQLVFERDNWTCQKCKSKKSLHCHHIEGIMWEPLESADIDKCITYCKKYHKEVHEKEGCKISDMRCNNGN